MKTIEASPASEVLRVILEGFARCKSMGDKTFAQLEDNDFLIQLNEESNSIGMLIQHISGNLVSRFTDFLTTDGEKENRNRDQEFEVVLTEKEALLTAWESGFAVLNQSLDDLTETDMTRIVFIRAEPHTVIEALLRSYSHISYHIGQIVQLAKAIKNQEWQTLSIKRGESAAFNQQMQEKAEEDDESEEK